MKLLIQRVLSASVTVQTTQIACIDEGLLVLLGFGQSDDERVLDKAIDKLLNLRIFADRQGRFQYSVLEQQKSVLVVPQFTLYGSTNAGRRPDFMAAMPPQAATRLFDEFCCRLKQTDLHQIGFGQFGADMQVSLVNDGPVTLMIEL